jgi:RNA recognition motif-containing protein
VTNIFVGNLSQTTTAASIRILFAPYGNVGHVKLMTDRATGQSRGFAFLEMIETEAASAIAGVNGRMVDGQELRVREGRQRLHARPSAAAPRS